MLSLVLLSLGLRDNHSFSLSPLPRPQTPPYQYLHVAECSEDSAKWPEEVDPPDKNNTIVNNNNDEPAGLC